MTVPIHALNGLELRKAVATALGREWTMMSGSPHYRLWEPVEPYEESLDACFAPNGPVERLRAEGWVVGVEVDERGAIAHALAERIIEQRSPSPAEAVCRAFLEAVDSPSGIPCDGSQE